MNISKYLASIGSKGGSAGRGAAKRRDPAFYKAISAKAAAKRIAKAAAKSVKASGNNTVLPQPASIDTLAMEKQA